MNRRVVVLGAGTTAGCAWLGGYWKKNQPKVVMKGAPRVLGVDFQQARLEAELGVTNNLPVAVPLSKLDWKVDVDALQLVAGQIAEAIQLPPATETAVKIPFSLRFDDVYRISEKYREHDDAPYRLAGMLHIDNPTGGAPFAIPFTQSGTFPVLKIPQVELSKVKLEGVSFSGANVKLALAVKNPNSRPLNLQKLDYTITLAGAQIATGTLPAALDLPAKGSGTFGTDIKISFAQAASAAEAIKRASNADYSIAGTLSAKTPWGDVASPFTKSGTVRIQK